MARQVLDNGVILPSEYSDDWYDDMTSNLTKLDEVIGSDAEKLSASDVGEAAISNDYDDLDDKPAYNILRRASVTLTAGGTGNYTDLDSTSKIKAGDYVLDAANKLYSITAIDAANSTYTVSSAAIINITDKSELGAAALSNSYDDLNNLPSYGITRYVNTAITDNSNVAFASISSVSKIAAGDFLLDTAGKMYVIASVDTANETAAVTTPLTQLATDSDVVHKSGNETVLGQKLFDDINTISSSAEIGVSGGNRSYKVRDKNKKTVASIEGGTFSTGMAYSYWLVNNGTDVFNGLFLYQASANLAQLRPFSSTLNMQLGASNRYFYDCYTSKINNLEPSSLFMPVDRGLRIDISGSFTDTSSGGINRYTIPANGWVYLAVTDTVILQVFSQTSGSLTNYGDTKGRSAPGNIFAILPVRKNDVFVSQWYTTLTNVTVTSAYFIPCQGNV